MIAREIIDEIAYRTDIVELIGSYVTLKRAGSNYNCNCPFHSEKTPSFTVFPATRSFYCFGCGAGGDAFTFVMKTENLDYVSAIEFLAARAGISVPHGDEQKNTKEIPRKRIYEMNLAAAKFFRNCLFDKDLGKAGMDYLAGQRKLSVATIKHFGLGYSPDSFGMLTDYMHKAGFNDEELTVGFLCGKSQKNGRTYDYFRGRVMFPIIDVTGNIVAFGGRVLDDSKPKYLNTSDTPGFKKSRTLFALNYAKNSCAEQIILCEGYMDVIALHAAGFENSIATLGTAITPEHARMLAKYTKKVIISYDSDAAGQNAANRAMRLLSEVGLDVRILQMGGAKDPDEYIKKFGADKFRYILTQSRTGFDFKIGGVLAKYDISLPEEKIKASNELCTIISEYPSPVEREVYTSIASKQLGISAEVLKNNIEHIIRKRISEYKNQQSRNAKISAARYNDRINLDSAKNIVANSAEETILGLLLLYDEYREAVAKGTIELSEDDFFTDFGKRIFSELFRLENTDGGFSMPLLGEKFSPDEMGRIQYLIRQRANLSENGVGVLKSSIETLKNARRRNEAANGGDKFSELKRKQEMLKNKKDKK